MLGSAKLANSIAPFVPTDQVEAVFGAVQKSRRRWLQLAIIALAFVSLTGIRPAWLGVSLTGLAAVISMLVLPRRLTVAVLTDSLVVFDMELLRARPHRERARLPRIGSIVLEPATSSGRQLFSFDGKTWITAGVSADVVRRVFAHS